MPLFVVKNNINELDVDAIGLPYCEGMKSCIDELFNIGGNDLKAFFKRQIEDIKEDSVALFPGFGLKAKNIIIYNCSSLEPGSFKNIENYQEKLIGIYESILNYAYAKELDYVAIPVIMPDEAEDDFLSVAVKTVRRFIYNSSRDVTVYLVNSDEYSFYRCDKEDLYNQCFSLNSGVRNYLGLGAFIGYAGAVACDACEESCRKEKNATVINNEYRKRSKKGSFSASDFKRLVADRIEEKDESFSQMVMRIIKERKLDHVRLYRAANVDKDIFSKINKDANGDLDKNGEPFIYKPKKNIVMSFIIALKLDLMEAEEMMRKAGYAKSNNSLFDKITFLAIEQGFYDLDEINMVLLEYDQPRLGSVVRENRD